MKTYVVGLSEFLWSMSKLAVLLEWAFSVSEVVLAHLSLVLLLKSIELSLVSIEVVIV